MTIQCSGAFVYSLDTSRFLFLHRASGKKSNLWGLVGGTNEYSESPWEGLQREISEEIGLINIRKTIPLEVFTSDDCFFTYYTYFCIVENEFIPKLNNEHDGYAWVSYKKWPSPLHQGVYNTLHNKINRAKIETVLKLVDLIN